tara:strand:+ start:4048 stop:5160 length:1113 start_codon:yes stop_codon:yes gene_type:complete
MCIFSIKFNLYIMKIKLLILGGIIPLFINSQITITNNDMPNVNDIYVYSIGNTNFSQSLTVAGSNVTWDFSDLTSQMQRADTFLSVSSTPLAYQFYFNNAFLYPNHKADYALRAEFPNNQNSPVQITEMINYFKNSTGEYSNVGFGANINGVPTSVKNEPVDVWYHFPMNFGNIESNYAEFGLSVPSFGYYGQSIQRYDTIDGYGTLITPYGTFQTIRLKSTVYRIDTTYSDQFGFGTTVPRPAEIEYSWLANNKGTPLLKIVERSGQITQVEYQDSIRTLGIFQPEQNIKVSIYPNPAKNILLIESDKRFNHTATLNLMNIAGKSLPVKYQIMDNKMLVNLKSVAQGIYFIQIFEEGKLLSTKKICVEK